MNIIAFPFRMKKIIAIMHQPNWIWAVLSLLVTALVTPAQAQVSPQQTMKQLPKAVPVTSLMVGQPQIPAEPSRFGWSEGGYLLYLGAPPSYHFPVSTAVPGDQIVTARNFLKERANLFGVASAAVDFSHLKTKFANNRHYVRLEQTYAGIPVFAAQVMVQVDAQNGIESVLSDIARNTKELDDGLVSLVPLISAVEASAKARNLFASQALGAEITTTALRLTIFAPSVLDEEGGIHLVWEMKVFSQNTAMVNEHLLLDAHSGEIVRQYPLNLPDLNRVISDANNTSDQITLARAEGQPPSEIADANAIYDFLGDTYNFYLNQHGRDSFDGSGGSLIAIVRYCNPNPTPPPLYLCPASSFWDSNHNRMHFGTASVTDDITGHEFTHGVTQFESGLVYANASGAINESFSDIWGEFVDLGNGRGNDDANVRWLFGEDKPNGATRNMQNPPALGRPWGTLVFPQPDRLSNFNHPVTVEVLPARGSGNGDGICDPGETCEIFDNGGVHVNSGINNKLCFLLTDGDAFNGQTVTGMGINRVAGLYYEVNTNLLSSGANFADLYYALIQAAVNLGWNAQERNNLHRACVAVEIAAPINIYVDGSSACAPTGSQFCGAAFGPFNTVAQGVEAIYPGNNVLFIRAGSYNEALTLEKIMEIRAYDGPVTIGH